MFSNLRLHTVRRPLASLTSLRRCYATEVNSSDLGMDEYEAKQRERYAEFLAQKEKEPPTRPQLKVEVNPDHGLYAFFRKVPAEGRTSLVAETVESIERPGTKMGRAWNATELRRKSFKDLHTLWYIVLRERNLVATQRAEGRRLGIMENHLGTAEKEKACKKTMARIKQILNERRLAYEQAYALDYASVVRYKQARSAREARKAEQEDAQKEPLSVIPADTVPTRGRRLKRVKKSVDTEASVNATPTTTTATV